MISGDKEWEKLVRDLARFTMTPLMRFLIYLNLTLGVIAIVACSVTARWPEALNTVCFTGCVILLLIVPPKLLPEMEES